MRVYACAYALVRSCTAACALAHVRLRLCACMLVLVMCFHNERVPNMTWTSTRKQGNTANIPTYSCSLAKKNVHTHMHACSHAHTCTHAYTRTHTHMHTHTYSHTHPHTRTHTQCTPVGKHTLVATPRCVIGMPSSAQMPENTHKSARAVVMQSCVCVCARVCLCVCVFVCVRVK